MGHANLIRRLIQKWTIVGKIIFAFLDLLTIQRGPVELAWSGQLS